jgi:hypothetical protein
VKFARVVLILLGALIIGACSKDVDLAKAQIDSFHARFNADDFSGIYASASDTLKAEMSEAQFTAKLRQLKRDQGSFVSTDLVSWRNTPAEHWATINYVSKFERGKPAEQFIYRTEGGDARLYGYFVNAKALVSCRTGMAGATGVRIEPAVPVEPQLFGTAFVGGLFALFGLYGLIVGSLSLDNLGTLSGWSARIPSFGIMVGGGLMVFEPVIGFFVMFGALVLAWVLFKVSES